MRQISSRFTSATAAIAAALILSPMTMPMAVAQVADPAAAPPLVVPPAAPPVLQTPPATPATVGETSPAIVITPPQPVVQSLPEPALQQAQEDAAPVRRASPDRSEGRAASKASSRPTVTNAQPRVEERTPPSVETAPMAPAPQPSIPEESVAPSPAETSAPVPATNGPSDDIADNNANLWLGGGAALLLLGGVAFFFFSRRRREEEADFTDGEFVREDMHIAPEAGRLRVETLSPAEAPLELGAFASRIEPSDGPEKQDSPASVQSPPNRTEVSPPVVGEGDAPSPENPFLTRRSRLRQAESLMAQSYFTTARLDDRPPLKVRDPRPGLNGEADHPLQLRYSFGEDEQPEPLWEPRFGRS